jgi:hypothetical protein
MTYYYEKRMEWLLKPLKEARTDLVGYLGRRYGYREASGIYEDALGECRNVIAALPDIGGDENPLTMALVGSAIGLGWYRVLKARGVPLEEAGKDIYVIFAILMPSLSLHAEPDISRGEIAGTKEFCERTALREYPENFVVDFVEGDDSCEYGMNVRECAVIKVFDRNGARELVPFMCILDRLIFSARGVGLVRTSTLASGGTCCDFRVRSQPGTALREPQSQRILQDWEITG